MVYNKELYKDKENKKIVISFTLLKANKIFKLKLNKIYSEQSYFLCASKREGPCRAHGNFNASPRLTAEYYGAGRSQGP